MGMGKQEPHYDAYLAHSLCLPRLLVRDRLSCGPPHRSVAAGMKEEDAFHVTVAEFLDLALPGDAFWSTVPAGGGGAIRGAQLKRKGYKAGTPDIIICWHGLAHFLELKAKRGVVSGNQKFIRGVLLRAGCRWACARTLEQVMDALAAWGIPTRGSA